MSDLTCIIGENIHTMRKLNGLTKSGLEKLLGCNRGAVHKWECGDNAPSAYYLFHLAKLFGCSIDRLFEGVDQ